MYLFHQFCFRFTVPKSTDHQNFLKTSHMLNGSIDKTCPDCSKESKKNVVYASDMFAVKGLSQNMAIPLETEHEENHIVSRHVEGRGESNKSNIEHLERDFSSNIGDHIFESNSMRVNIDSDTVKEPISVHNKQNGILSGHRTVTKSKNDCQSSMQSDSNLKCQEQNKSFSVDGLHISSHGDELTSVSRDITKLSNGKCEPSNSSAPTNTRNYKTLNNDLRKKNLVVCHEEDTAKEKDSLFGKSRYRSSLNSTDSGALNRNRKRSFMNLPQRCHVPKAVQISSETKKETKLARISLCIVWLFIFCHVWKLIPTAYETFFIEDMTVGLKIEWPYWLDIVKEVSHSLITINSGLNFLIYIVL